MRNLLVVIIPAILLLTCSGGESPAPKGTLEFTQQIIDPVEDNFLSLLADIDGDGQCDVLGVGPSDDSGGDWTRVITWYRNPGWARDTLISFEEYGDYTYFKSSEMKTRDMDDDGDLDIISAIGKEPRVVTDGVLVAWWENPLPAHPVAAEWRRHDVGRMAYPKDIVLDADLDGDGRCDIIARGERVLNIFFRDADDVWSGIDFPIRQYEGLSAGDLDDDGDPDIAVNGVWYETSENPRAGTYGEHIYEEKWLPENQPASWTWARGGCKIRIADLDQNGKLDILVSPAEAMAKQLPVAWYYTADPKGGAWTECVLESNIERAHTLQVADFNLDGKPDVLCGAMKRDNNPDHGLWIYLQGDSPLEWSRHTIQTMGSYCASIGDVEGDGDPDVVTVRDCFLAQPTELWENQVIHAAKVKIEK